jgi:hypothetical protein
LLRNARDGSRLGLRSPACAEGSPELAAIGHHGSMNAPSHRAAAAPPRSFHAVFLLPALAVLAAGCGNAAPPPAKVPEVPIAPVAAAGPAETSAAAQPEPPPPAREKVEPLDPLLGRSKEHAIEVCGPPGQREYLSVLRCTDGKPPSFGRAGNVGERNDPAGKVPESVMISQMNPRRVLRPGEVDYHIVDLYKVGCSDGDQSLFLDMYHCAGPQTSVPPSGFTMELEGAI